MGLPALVPLFAEIPDASDFNVGKWKDSTVMAGVGGRDRTRTDFEKLFSEAGFVLEQIVPAALGLIRDRSQLVYRNGTGAVELTQCRGLPSGGAHWDGPGEPHLL